MGGNIRKSALRTQGSQSPSGLYACEWRRLLTSLKNHTIDLCKTLAQLTIRIATEKLTFLGPYNARRLIALTKSPGVTPIGVGEVLRCIIGRTLIFCLRTDLEVFGGNTHFCLGQKCGIEYANNSLEEEFEKPDAEAILLIDAKNAFKSLNRNLPLDFIWKLLIPACNEFELCLDPH